MDLWVRYEDGTPEGTWFIMPLYLEVVGSTGEKPDNILRFRNPGA
jgi:hypothetical protein